MNLKNLSSDEKDMLRTLMDYIDEKVIATGENPWIKTPAEYTKMFQKFFRMDIFILKGDFENVSNSTKSIGYKMGGDAYHALDAMFTEEDAEVEA